MSDVSHVVTSRYGRLIDLQQFRPEHHDRIIEAVECAERAAIVATPDRYVADRHLVALRERHHREVTPSAEQWWTLLDITTGDVISQGDTLRDAYRPVRDAYRTAQAV